MAQVFDNAYTSVKNIVIDGLLVTWEENNSSSSPESGTGIIFPLLLTGVQIQYQRQAVPYNTLNIGQNGSRLLQIMGRPTGIMTVQSAIGSAEDDSSLDTFLAAAGRTCGKGVKMYMSPTQDGSTGRYGGVDEDLNNCLESGMKYVITGAFLTQFNVSAQAGQGQITIADSLSFAFTSMYVSRGKIRNPYTLRGEAVGQ